MMKVKWRQRGEALHVALDGNKIKMCSLIMNLKQKDREKMDVSDRRQ